MLQAQRTHHSLHKSLSACLDEIKEKWKENFVCIDDRIEPSNCENINDEILKKMSKSIMTHNWKHVRHLWLDLSFCKNAGNTGLVMLAESIGENLTGLKELTLDLKHCSQIANSFLKTFGTYTLSRLTDLELLILDFESCNNIKEKDVEILVRNISQYSTKLHTLEIYLSNCNLKSDCYEKLVSTICRRLQKLKNLALDCSGSQHIDQVSLNEILSKMSRHRQELRNLTLNLTSCSRISIPKLINVKTTTSLNKLQCLTLIFRNCKGLNDMSLTCFGSWLSQLFSTVKHLILHFSQCAMITDQGLEALGYEIVENAKNLKQLEVYFSSCEKVSDTGLERFGFAIASSGCNFVHVTLDFSRCIKVTVEGRKTLAQNLAHIPVLYLY